MTATVASTLATGARRLRESGSPSARLDAELLLGHAIGRDRAWLLAHGDAAIPADAVTAVEDMLERRAAGEPVAYIRGWKEWHSLRVRTDRRALIPRPETELLADAAAAEITARLEAGVRRVVAWDVATGSGAVALALALRFRGPLSEGRAALIASDVSADALALAAENLEAHDVDHVCTLVCADLLAPAGDTVPKPDVVTANLPYVSSAEVDERWGSLGFEPRVALDGGTDGLVLLRRLLGEVPSRVAAGATLLLEIGVGQADDIAAMAPAGAVTAIVPDLAGLDRVVAVRMPEPGT